MCLARVAGGEPLFQATRLALLGRGLIGTSSMTTGSRTSTLPSDVDACREALRAVNLRVTPARVAVLQLIREADRPLSHADICELLSGDVWNRTTVWRNLSDLEGAGLVRRTELGDRLWRFEGASQSGAHALEAHPHFLCTSCGEVSCLPDELLKIPTSLVVPRSVRERQIEVQVRGVCDKCD